MIDASHEPFEKNAEITRKVVEYAHKHNCVVEGELGHLVGAQFDEGEEGGAHSTSGHYTNPEEAVKVRQRNRLRFPRRRHRQQPRRLTSSRANNTSISNASSHQEGPHGRQPRRLPARPCTAPPACRKNLADEINKYGGKMPDDTAGVPEADIEVARRVGCTKVNIDTDLRMAMTAGIRKVFSENPKEFDPRKYWAPPASQPQVKELVRHKVKNVLCCAGHAFDSAC
jgi:fructose-bisphosphate aldolase, class II